MGTYYTGSEDEWSGGAGGETKVLTGTKRCIVCNFVICVPYLRPVLRNRDCILASEGEVNSKSRLCLIKFKLI